MLTKRIIWVAVLIGIFTFFYLREKDENYYDLLIVSGATPLAVARKVPADYSLTVNGLVKKEYRFSGSALNGFASTRIRTREFTPDGRYVGAYAYLGIPVFHILEGIAPKKPDGAALDQPLDMLVTFTSASGAKVNFSYNELLMVDDRHPVTLAYKREPLLPTNEKARETYKLNLNQAPLTGLRVICPREPDTARYLDHIVTITLSEPATPEGLLPPRQKGIRCESDTVLCVEGGKIQAAVTDNLSVIHNDHWVRIGHGHGFDGVAKLEGFELQSFLRANFPGAEGRDFFIFVSCDGYRCLYSGREIFDTVEGRSMMIALTLDDQRPKGGPMLVPADDFFHDRAMWGLSHILRLRPTS
jgi:hypothetical protein